MTDRVFLDTNVLVYLYDAGAMAEADVLEAMHDLRELPTVKIDVPMIFGAIELGRRYQLSFWDALIARAALSAGCAYLYTEDLQQQMRIGDLTVENPFLAS